jgi:hypothetical protein|nr:MAG TPA: hypothetical protein [Caudoviricetes sp.]
MTTKLQQVIARSKVATLDDKLRGIAERALKEKFGDKERHRRVTLEDIRRVLLRDSYSGALSDKPVVENRDTYDFRAYTIRVNVKQPKVAYLHRAASFIYEELHGRQGKNPRMLTDPLFFELLKSDAEPFRLDTLGYEVEVRPAMIGCILAVDVCE